MTVINNDNKIISSGKDRLIFLNLDSGTEVVPGGLTGTTPPIANEVK